MMLLMDLIKKLTISILEVSKMNQKIDKVFDELDKLIDDCCDMIAKKKSKSVAKK